MLLMAYLSKLRVTWLFKFDTVTALLDLLATILFSRGFSKLKLPTFIISGAATL
jgi:hypothetical protein